MEEVEEPKRRLRPWKRHEKEEAEAPAKCYGPRLREDKPAGSYTLRDPARRSSFFIAVLIVAIALHLTFLLHFLYLSLFH